MNYVFNRITVNPQLPKRIERLSEIANNLWWSWNTEFLKLFKAIDWEVWDKCGKNPVKFLKQVEQAKLESIAKNADFLSDYDEIVRNFDGYMNSKNTWFRKTYPEYTDELFAYFSAEYGIDEILSIYSGGLGILSGDHVKSASDLGLPFVAVGLLYKNGYFHQRINASGIQEQEYKNIDLYNLPILPVKDENDEELIIDVRFPRKKIYLKVWKINVGRVTLYLLDSDIPQNTDDYRNVTLKLYGGDREMRIQQEIVLGMGGVRLLKTLGLKPTIYHMNEGHSAFATLELIKDVMAEQGVSFDVAREIITKKTVFTTHTPVPAGNDIFDIDLVERYFKNFWPRLELDREQFLRLGMKSNDGELEHGFNMGYLALKISGKKNGVSKLHGAVSRELFGDLWPNIAANESPITHITNGIHTCSWLAQGLKELYNKYLIPYWQDSIFDQDTWKKIENIPNEKLWNEHCKRKEKLVETIKTNINQRFKGTYVDTRELLAGLNPDALTIGFARRFATYKRATLIFKDIERITKILNDEQRPVQLVFAGKAHPADKEGQDWIKYIHEISMMPQFKGKVFLLEDYNIAVARRLVSGVDVWLNNPRRPMEASGTSGQKASINGVVNFSILDGWWAEGYNQKNGWAIGTNEEYDSYEEQDRADSESIYSTLENVIIPTYYAKEKNGISPEWMKYMKESIMSTGAEFSTARMVVDYTNKLYMPLCKVSREYYNNIDTVKEYDAWKKSMYTNWEDITITQLNNLDNISIDAGNNIDVMCSVNLPHIDVEHITAQVYYGRIQENGTVENISIIPMTLINSDDNERNYTFAAKIELKTGGNYGYTFRVMPKHPMLLDPENMDLIKWITK